MKNIFLYISFMLLTTLFISCTEKSETKKELPKLENILNDKIVIDEELGITYQTPFNWNEMPASLSEKFVARLSGKDKNNLIVYSPKSFFYDDNSSSLLRVGRVSLKDKSISELLTLEKYIELFEKYNSKLKIERTEIQFNQFKAFEMKIEKGNLTSFKIIFHNRVQEIIQLDFSITNKNISKLKASIDASIKSIKLL
ncbi:MAG: hypothetical protein L3J41_08680 [Melioribacteraceae bacterium]|nr:hypothetical protein [Melioribacteraceae bacterium]